MEDKSNANVENKFSNNMAEFKYFGMIEQIKIVFMASLEGYWIQNWLLPFSSEFYFMCVCVCVCVCV